MIMLTIILMMMMTIDLHFHKANLYSKRMIMMMLILMMIMIIIILMMRMIMVFQPVLSRYNIPARGTFQMYLSSNFFPCHICTYIYVDIHFIINLHILTEDNTCWYFSELFGMLWSFFRWSDHLLETSARGFSITSTSKAGLGS